MSLVLSRSVACPQSENPMAVSAPYSPPEMSESFAFLPVINSGCASLTSCCLLTFVGHQDEVLILGSSDGL